MRLIMRSFVVESDRSHWTFSFVSVLLAIFPPLESVNRLVHGSSSNVLTVLTIHWNIGTLEYQEEQLCDMFTFNVFRCKSS